MRRILAFAFAVLFAVPTLGQFDTKNWQWRARVAAPARAGIVGLPLDGMVYDVLLNSPQDLRVVHSDGSLVPHAVRCAPER